MCTFKLDLSDLFKAYKRWNAPISTGEREKWGGHFELLVQVGELRFPRVVIPEGAVDLNMELLGAGDASERMTCAACYVRFRLKDGSYSCQLILAKTKIVQEGTTLPRAELLAAVLNAHLCHIVRRALKDRVSGQILITDSEIALYWMNNDTKHLKPWTRNRAIEVNRFSEPGERYHVASELNPADIGTRRGVSIEDVSPGSRWQCGQPWMQLSFDAMRESYLSSVEDIRYRKEQLAEIRKESAVVSPDLSTSGFLVVSRQRKRQEGGYECCLVDRMADPIVQQISKKVKERLEFSNYIVDPNRFTFNKSVRVVSLVIKASKLLQERWGIKKKLEGFSYAIQDDDSVYTNHLIFEKIKPQA